MNEGRQSKRPQTAQKSQSDPDCFKQGTKPKRKLNKWPIKSSPSRIYEAHMPPQTQKMSK